MRCMVDVFWPPQARMSALAKLLPEAAAKLPRLVVRHPYLLVKSPGAVARSILQVRPSLSCSHAALQALKGLQRPGNSEGLAEVLQKCPA